MEEICCLFAMLDHREQLRVLETLPRLIKVDFVAGLPLLAVERIISYLSVSDVLNSSMVCWRWFSIIMKCRKYWMNVCIRAGLSEAHVNSHIENESSIIKFALTIQCHLSKAKNMLALPMQTVVTPDSAVSQRTYQYHAFNAIVWRSFIKSSTNFSSTCFGDVVFYEEFQNISEFIYVKRTYHPVIVRNVFDQCFKVSWAAVFGKSLIIATNNAEWIAIEDKIVKKKWIDSEVVSSFQTQFSLCSKCGLVVQVCRDSRYDDMLHWVIFCVMLMETNVQTSRLRYNLVLSTVDKNLKENDALFLQSIALVPWCDMSGSDTKQFCTSHLLLLQLNRSVIVFTATSDYKHSLKLVLQRVLHANQDSVNPLLNLAITKNTFRLSATNNILAMIEGCSLVVWDICSRKPASRFNLLGLFQSVGDLSLIAVGELYCALHYKLDLVLLSTLTGLIVYKTCLANIQSSERGDIHLFFLQQDWMNSSNNLIN